MKRLERDAEAPLYPIAAIKRVCQPTVTPRMYRALVVRGQSNLARLANSRLPYRELALYFLSITREENR
jgi:hypothetical protein